MTKPTEYQIRFEELQVSKSCIEYVMGFTPGESPSPFNEIIDEVLQDAKDHCEIKGAIRIIEDFSMDIQNNSIKADHTEFQTERRITSLLEKSEALALFIVTAGKGMEQWMHESMVRGDTFSSYVIDVTGSEIVDLAAVQLQNKLEQQIQPSGLNVTDMFSPGYCGWPVSDQHSLFSFFPEGSCGIHLTESSLMDPIKSISGITGIGKHAKRNREDYCSHCGHTECIYRGRRHQHG
ncbi:MAG: vitamin B12 dependent-methionine synthase activation domain-containing protein [Bacteroidales bacterium]